MFDGFSLTLIKSRVFEECLINRTIQRTTNSLYSVCNLYSIFLLLKFLFSLFCSLVFSDKLFVLLTVIIAFPINLKCRSSTVLCVQYVLSSLRVYFLNLRCCRKRHKKTPGEGKSLLFMDLLKRLFRRMVTSRLLSFFCEYRRLHDSCYLFNHRHAVG